MRFHTKLVLALCIVVMVSLSACGNIEPVEDFSAWETGSEDECYFQEVIDTTDASSQETENIETVLYCDESDSTESSSEGFLADLFSSLFPLCEHTEVVKSYSFQPRNSTAVNYMKKRCKDCNQVIYRNDFYDNPEDLSYLDVMNNGEHFVEGEYYTIEAKVQYNFFDHDLKVKCIVEKDDVSVFFTVTFTEEYKEESGLLKEGDVITFHGKSAPEGRLYWTDCELITD